MARVFSWLDLVRKVPAERADINRMANEIGRLRSVVAGYGILIGSAAWGEASWRSDIDVLSFKCNLTTNLSSEIDGLRGQYEKTLQHSMPNVEIIWVGAEREDMVERDNLVSGSAPILEPRRVSEILDRVRVRLSDHVRALARAKGNPWQTFADTYLKPTAADDALLLEIVKDYSVKSAESWRELDWATNGGALTEAHLKQLGYAEGFAIHFARLILSTQRSYPIPDRRKDVQVAITQLGRWGDRLSTALAPFFALSIKYNELARRIRDDEPVTRTEFDRDLLSAAADIDFGAVESFTWSYLSECASRRQI